MKLKMCAAAVCVVLAGCQTPYVSPKPLALQSRIDTVQDWKLLADRMISPPPPVREKRAHSQRYFLDEVSQDKPVYVDIGKDPSEFAVAFGNLLNNRLYDYGYQVAYSPVGARVLSFQTQTFHYNQRKKDSFFYHATPWAVLGGVVSAVHGISSVDTGIAAAAIAAPAYDFFDALDDRTNTELFVTLRLQDGNHLIFMRSEPLYVRAYDLKFYMDTAESHTITVSANKETGW